MVAWYRLPDGTPVFHPVGELRVDRDDQKVRCGLCGRWFRALGGHLGPAHDRSADDYRRAFGRGSCAAAWRRRRGRALSPVSA